MTKRKRKSRSDLPDAVIPESIGRRIHLWRKCFKLTQSQVETRAGLSHNTLSRIENGLNEPHLDTVNNIAEAMGISQEQLMLRLPPKVDASQFDSSLEQLMTRLMQLGDGKRQIVLNALNTLLDQMTD